MRCRARFERKWADTWIGAYWSKDETWRSGTVWVCVVPCFPLKIDWWRTRGDESLGTAELVADGD